MTSGGIKRSFMAAASVALASFGGVVQANPRPWQMNMTRGVSTYSHIPYDLNQISLITVTVIGVLVFTTMGIAMFRFRKSRGAVAEKWAHNTALEVTWTTIPLLILIVLAYLATGGLETWANTTGSQMTVKITGYQWKWRYDYISYLGKPIEKVGFMSKLDKQSDETRQLGSGLDPYAVKVGNENTYLLNVDKPLVVPIHTKIRFLITGGDVVHDWWVPDLGWKLDAVPGVINSAWTNIMKAGTYRGQCAQLCGQDHAYMPIVVVAKSKADFAKWLSEQEADSKNYQPPPASFDESPQAAAARD